MHISQKFQDLWLKKIPTTIYCGSNEKPPVFIGKTLKIRQKTTCVTLTNNVK